MSESVSIYCNFELFPPKHGRILSYYFLDNIKFDPSNAQKPSQKGFVEIFLSLSKEYKLNCSYLKFLSSKRTF